MSSLSVLLMDRLDRNAILTSFVIILLVFILLKSRNISLRKTWDKLYHPNEHGSTWETMMQLFEHSVLPLFAIDGHGVILACNRRAEKKFLWSKKEFMGANIEMIIPVEERLAFSDGLFQFRTTGKWDLIDNKYGIEFPALKKDGTKIPIRVWLSEISESGLIKIGVSAADISKELEHEKELAEQVSLLNKGEEIAQMGTWCWDLSGTDVKVSTYMRKLYGFDDDEHITVESLMKKVYYEDVDRVRSAVAGVVENKQDYEVEYRIIQDNGLFTHVKVMGRVMVGEEGYVKVINGTAQKQSQGNNNGT